MKERWLSCCLFELTQCLKHKHVPDFIIIPLLLLLLACRHIRVSVSACSLVLAGTAVHLIQVCYAECFMKGQDWNVSLPLSSLTLYRSL